jgi:hypothetical protein
MSADQFTQIFREEHRAVRDGLLDLILAFQERDRNRIQSLLGQVAALTGPHFRYEEEALYPGLVEIFGEEYVEKLLGDHDQAIGRAKALVELAGKEQLSNDDVTKATRIIRTILPHVSDCDGLSIMVERLPESKVRSVLEARDRSHQAGLDLLRWASQVRTRPVAHVSLAS